MKLNFISVRSLTFMFAIALVATPASAHFRLKPTNEVAIRSQQTGLKTGPCGNQPRLASYPTLTAGQSFVVTWEETIQHPGRYEFSLSTGNDQNFVLLATVPDTQDERNDLPHQYSTTLTLPAGVTCDACTLQAIQVMTDVPTNPTNYYSCADLHIVSVGTPIPTTPTSTPIPSAGEPMCGVK